jgi:phosphoesterase RecJ-like protein
MKLIRIIKDNRRIVIGTHFDPDGDAICSSLAFAHLVRHYHRRRPVLFCRSPIPGRFRFLLQDWRFTNRLPPFDLLVLIDSAGISRVFPDYGEHTGHYPSDKIVNIDHHKSNELFGAVKIVDENASSACEIVYRLYKKLGLGISRSRAEIFYAGVYAETGGFQYPNTTPAALRVAADLIAIGVDPGRIAKRLNAKTLAGTRLLSRVLNTIEIQRGVGTMILTQRMLKDSRAVMGDSENFVSFLQAINGVRISVFLREEKDCTRLSLRSDGIADVDKITHSFGGGGHRLAAGVRMKESYPVAKKLILRAIFRELKKTT